MILYKTKYYGLLGDRVRKAIAESGREYKPGNHAWQRELKRNVLGETPTSHGTLGNLFDLEFRPMRDWRLEIRNYIKNHTSGLSEKELDQEVEYFMKEYYKSDWDKFMKSTKQYINQKNLRAISPLTDQLYPRELADVYNLAIKSNKIDLHNSTVRLRNKCNEVALESGKRVRKNPNDKILIQDIKDELEKIAPGANFETNYSKSTAKMGGEDREDRGIYLNKPAPGLGYHELQHYLDWVNGKLNGKWEPEFKLTYPAGVWDSLRKEADWDEARANKLGFRKLFLNKHSGGRDWRSMNHSSHASNKSYYGSLGIDIDKIGMQDLDYNMSPEALKKMRENAKKLGIDLNKTNKVSKETPTKEQLDRVMKYVEENRDRL